MFWIIAGLVFVAFFFATCVCCGCTQFEDLFTRADSSSIGSDWTEEAGSWEISGNELRATSTNAVAVYAHAPTTDSYTVQVEFDAVQANGSYRIYARLDDENYVCGEMYRVGADPGGTAKLRIISCTSGTETILAEVGGPAASAPPFWLRLCVDYDQGVTAFGQVPLAGNAESSLTTVVVAQVLPPGNQIAIGTGDTLHTNGFVDVESFVVKNYTSACPNCFFACGTEWPRFEVQVELDGFDATGPGSCNTCSDLHGTYTLTLQGRGQSNDYGFGGNMIYMLNIPGSTCGIDSIYLTVSSNSGTNNELRLFISQNPYNDDPSILSYTSMTGYVSVPSSPNNNACTEGANTGSNTFVGDLGLCDYVNMFAVPVYIEFL